MVDVVGPSSPITVCDNQTSVMCSDYSFIHIVPTYQSASTLPSSIFIISSGYQFSRINIPPSTSSSGISLSGLDFYYPIPSNSSYLSLEFNNFSFGTISYEFLTSVSTGISPSGSITLTENGTYDVTNYAFAVVDVPSEVIQGDYHNDLVNIYNAIILCAGVCMVLYFFYSIYRFLIKSTGGWR